MTTTDATCSDACWYAREDDCRCICSGKNHGILRDKNGKRPDRTRRVGSRRYRLIAVCKSHGDAHEFIAAWREERDIPWGVTARTSITDAYSGSPVRTSMATRQQAAKWPELSDYREAAAAGDWQWYDAQPTLVWEYAGGLG